MTIGTCLVAFYIPVGPGSINLLWLRTENTVPIFSVLEMQSIYSILYTVLRIIGLYLSQSGLSIDLYNCSISR